MVEDECLTVAGIGHFPWDDDILLAGLLYVHGYSFNVSTTP